MDTVFILSILLVFLTALIGGYLQRRRSDRVLRDFTGFHSTVRMKTGQKIWGCLRNYPRSMELVFSRPHKNNHGNTITSYLLFSGGMEQMELLSRYHQELTPRNQQRRLKEIRKAYNPGFHRRFFRSLRNFLAAFRDAFEESLGLLISRVKAGSAHAILQTQDKRLTKIGQGALNMVDQTSWDPVLERYIARKVVLEVIRADGETEEYAGVLKEYSSNWIEVLDCRQKKRETLPLNDAERLMLQRKLDFWIRLEAGSNRESSVDMVIRIKNESSEEIALWSITAKEFSQDIDRILAPAELVDVRLENLPLSALNEINLVELPLEISLIGPERQPNAVEQEINTEVQPALPELYLEYETTQEVDVIAPRSTGVIRHGGEFL